MTGNQDRTNRAQQDLDELYDTLHRLKNEKVVTFLKDTELTPGDSLGAQRYVRALDLTGKFGLTLFKMMTQQAPRIPKAKDGPKADDAHASFEPAAPTRDIIDGVNAFMRDRGMVVEPGCWPVARAEPEPFSVVGASMA